MVVFKRGEGVCDPEGADGSDRSLQLLMKENCPIKSQADIKPRAINELKKSIGMDLFLYEGEKTQTPP